MNLLIEAIESEKAVCWSWSGKNNVDAPKNPADQSVYWTHRVDYLRLEKDFILIVKVKGRSDGFLKGFYSEECIMVLDRPAGFTVLVCSVFN